MTDQPAADLEIEARVAALEAAVARLVDIVEPSLAASHLAAPIAFPWQKEVAQHEFVARFFALLDLGESLIKYSAALALAALCHAQPASEQAATEFLRQPAPLGGWITSLRNTLNDPAVNTWPIEILRGIFRRPNTKPTDTARYLFDEFVRIRNRERGHGSQQPDGYYEDLYRNNYMSVHDCVRASTHVRLPLVYLHAVDHREGRYAYKVTLLMGVSPATLSEPIHTSIRVPVRSTCLWDRGAFLLPLNDFLVHQYCRTCYMEHSFFSERITAEQVAFHSYIGNHRQTVDRARE